MSKLLDEFNTCKKTFDWGGVDLLPLPFIADRVGFSDRLFLIMLEAGLKREKINLEDVTEEFHWDILELLVHDDYKHVFENVDKSEPILCLNRYAVSVILHDFFKQVVGELFSPYNELGQIFKKEIL